MHYKVTSSLVVQLHPGQPPIDMMGCYSRILTKSQTYYSVKFEKTGFPYLVDKKIFKEAITPMEEIEDRTNYHEVHDIRLYLDERLIKTYRGIIFENTDKEYIIKNNVHKWFNLRWNINYNRIETTFLRGEGIKHQNQMAKRTIDITPVEGEATGTTLAKFEERAKTLSLPAIPAVMEIGGLQFSTESIQKQVDEVKQIFMTDETDAKTYAELKKKKAEFVKTRTQPDKFRQEISKPINAWTKELKERTDSYGNIAKIGETHCTEQMKIYEDWEAEQTRLETEAIEIRVKERSQQLSELQGVKNFDSGHWTFPYAPHLFIEPTALENEFGWDDEYIEVKEAFDAYLVEKEQEEAKAGDIANALVNARLMLLEMMQYTESNGTFLKNGHVLTADTIKTASDSEWKEIIQSHNAPVPTTVKESTPFSTPAPDPGAVTVVVQPATNTGSPFAQFIKQPEVVQLTSDNEAKEMSPAVAEVFNPGVITKWSEETPFVEGELATTIIRVYPDEFKVVSENINKDIIGFEGVLGNGLNFIIYKK